ncbi:hypothetical protein [Streptomyces phytophilus]|uniref:hypothetical protein n=1 Tax=Streptomyces phytophilus TaxID=722715 RepID=UPI0015F112B3|nr:hypothetical protein [Streptomyces phytophilus]
MPDPTADDLRAVTETLSHLTDYLRSGPDPDEALALAEPLLDELTGLPLQFADTLRALARALHDHPDTPRTTEAGLLIAQVRAAASAQADHHALHYLLDDLRDLYDAGAASGPGCAWCR